MSANYHFRTEMMAFVLCLLLR